MISEKANYHCLQTGLARALPVSPPQPQGLSPLRAPASPHRRAPSQRFGWGFFYLILIIIIFLLIYRGPRSQLGQPASRPAPAGPGQPPPSGSAPRRRGPRAAAGGGRPSPGEAAPGSAAGRGAPRCWKSFSSSATPRTSGWRYAGLCLCLPSPPLAASTAGIAATGPLGQPGGLCSSGCFPPSFLLSSSSSPFFLVLLLLPAAASTRGAGRAAAQLHSPRLSAPSNSCVYSLRM